ncbi:MAG: RNA polymerase sigma factor [Bacteroidota bacterium]
MDRTQLEHELQTLHPQSYGWALSCCQRDTHLAREALQQAYLKVLEGKAQFRGQSSFKTWFFAVIRFTAIDLMNQEARLANRKAPLFEPQADDPDAKNSTDWTHLRQAIANLPDKQREILHLVFYQGLTLDEAAHVMQVAPGTARQHYHRAKTKLKNQLQAKP